MQSLLCYREPGRRHKYKGRAQPHQAAASFPGINQTILMAPPHVPPAFPRGIHIPKTNPMSSWSMRNHLRTFLSFVPSHSLLQSFKNALQLKAGPPAHCQPHCPLSSPQALIKGWINSKWGKHLFSGGFAQYPQGSSFMTKQSRGSTGNMPTHSSVVFCHHGPTWPRQEGHSCSSGWDGSSFPSFCHSLISTYHAALFSQCSGK